MYKDNITIANWSLKRNELSDYEQKKAHLFFQYRKKRFVSIKNPTCNISEGIYKLVNIKRRAYIVLTIRKDRSFTVYHRGLGYLKGILDCHGNKLSYRGLNILFGANKEIILAFHRANNNIFFKFH